MKVVKLTDTVAVSAQISAEDVAEIAAQGYRVLINNRPDGEESTQPAGAAIAAAAQAAGLEYHHIPVTAASFPGEHFDAMSDLLDDPQRPVLAFCRSGTRCANLWVSSVDEPQREEAKRIAGRLGYELAMASRYLEQA